MLELPPIRPGCRRGRRFADEPEPAVDRDVRYILPNTGAAIIGSGLACLDRHLLVLSVALLRRRDQARIDDLAGHRDVSPLVELPVEGLHHPLQRARLGQAISEVTDRILVRRRRAQIEAQEAHLGLSSLV